MMLLVNASRSSGIFLVITSLFLMENVLAAAVDPTDDASRDAATAPVFRLYTNHTQGRRRNEIIAKPNQGGIPFPTSIEKVPDYLKEIRRQAAFQLEEEEEEAEVNVRRSLRPERVVSCGHPPPRQLVYLEFPSTSSSTTFVAYNPFSMMDEEGATSMETFESFSLQEKEDQQRILQQIQKDYQGFAIDFVLTRPAGQDEDHGASACRRRRYYSTLTFEVPEGVVAMDEFGILFGQAEQIDPFNRDPSDTAFINVNTWTWLVQLAERSLPPDAIICLGEDDDICFDLSLSNEEIQAQVRNFTINQAANTASHELGHLLGLRHVDSFGSQGANGGMEFLDIGGGASVSFAPGDQSGTETWNHLMASGESVGLPVSSNALSDRYFSERSAIKLLLGTQVSKTRRRVYTEEQAKFRGGRSNNKGILLQHLTVPNTILQGQFAGTKQLATSTVLIADARIETPDEVDSYRFYFEKGQFINLEVFGFSRPSNGVEDLVITGLTLSKELWEEDGSRLVVPIETSYQGDFESFDPLLMDLEILETGTYVVDVYAQKFACLVVPLEGVDDPLIDCFPLLGGDAVFNTGTYDLLVYSIDRALGAA